MMSAGELEKVERTKIFTRSPLCNKIAFMADWVPVCCVLNTILFIYRKRSNMRCAFVVFVAICLIAFSLDGRFVLIVFVYGYLEFNHSGTLKCLR